VFHSLFTTVITFCQFLFEVYELCFTVCLLQLLLFDCSKQTVKHNSLISYKNWQKVIIVVNKLWNTTHKLLVSSCLKSMSCVSQFVYYSYYFLPVLVWSQWVVFHSLFTTVITFFSVLVWSLWVVFYSLFTTVITFCQFLFEVYELCFTVCLQK
jgi:hypothetical protein